MNVIYLAHAFIDTEYAEDLSLRKPEESYTKALSKFNSWFYFFWIVIFARFKMLGFGRYSEPVIVPHICFHSCLYNCRKQWLQIVVFTTLDHKGEWEAT